eukprot:SAG22_NODE_1305_length_4793_cov_3.652961_3_plen_83_part_00
MPADSGGQAAKNGTGRAAGGTGRGGGGGGGGGGGQLVHCQVQDGRAKGQTHRGRTVMAVMLSVTVIPSLNTSGWLDEADGSS